MNDSRLLVDHSGPIARITLNRPAIHNAFDEVMISELTTAFGDLSEESGIRAIVITGAESSFCAGGDLDWMRRMAAFSREENLEDARNLQRMFAVIAESPKVTIARVNGSAFGGGAGLAAVCDVVIAADSAQFGFTEARLGIAPAVISPYVVRRIGYSAAAALFVTGDRIPAAEALRIGLINGVVESAALDRAISAVTDSVLKCGPNAIAATKRLLREVAERSPSDSAALTVESIVDLRASDEGQEGIRAFLEKRSPSYSGIKKLSGDED